MQGRLFHETSRRNFEVFGGGKCTKASRPQRTKSLFIFRTAPISGRPSKVFTFSETNKYPSTAAAPCGLRMEGAFPQGKLMETPLLGSRPIPGAGSWGENLSGQPRGGTTHHVTHLTHEFLRFVTVDQIFHLPGKILHFLRIHKVLHFVGCIRKTLGSHNVLIFCGRRWQPMGEERNKMQAPNRISQMTHTRCECMAVQTKENPC